MDHAEFVAMLRAMFEGGEYPSETSLHDLVSHALGCDHPECVSATADPQRNMCERVPVLAQALFGDADLTPFQQLAAVALHVKLWGEHNIRIWPDRY